MTTLVSLPAALSNAWKALRTVPAVWDAQWRATYRTCAASLLALHTRVQSSLSAPLTTRRSSSTVCSDAGRLLGLKPRIISVVYAGSGVFVLESDPGTKTPRILLARMSTTAPSAHFTQPAQFHAPRDSPCTDQTIHVQRCHVVSARAFDEGRLPPSVRHAPAFVHP
jgi:hypothetical protein